MASSYFENDGGKSMQELVDESRKNNPQSFGSPLVLTDTMGDRKDKALMFIRVGTMGELRPDDIAALNPDEEVYDDTAKKVVRLGDLPIYKEAIRGR